MRIRGMEMKGVKIIYISSLIGIALALLLLSVVYSLFSPQTISVPEEFTTFHGTIVELDDHSIISIFISNEQGRDVRYDFLVSEDSSPFENRSVLIRDGKSFLFEHYVYPKESRKREVTILVYEDSKPEPIENTTYYV